MTDKIRTKELFEHLGIAYNYHLNEYKHLAGWEHIESVITIAPDKTGKVVGYSGCMAEFYFDKDDGFVQVGIWED
jgi:hypothetical protein